MNKAMPAKQRGLGFFGFILGAFVLVLASIGGLKLIPAYMENGKVQKAFDAITHDPAMQTATVAEIKDSFYKRAITMDSVTGVSTDDIVISREGGSLALSASYSKKIPLAGNVSLLIEFNPSAPK